MNVILLTEEELVRPLGLRDERAVHILEVLRFGVGDSLDVGLVNGPMGKATIRAVGETGIVLDYRFSSDIEALHPVTMIIGLPRPPSSRRILKDLTSMGVSQMHFVVTEKGEKSYGRSRLWKGDEYERLLLEGAQQAFSTRLPEVTVHDSLRTCLEPGFDDTDRLALDNYEAVCSLREYRPCHDHGTLAVGSERGWSAAERDLLREHGFTLASLGNRVLKTETACIAGLAIVLEKLQAL
jgi:RsmE family RNA methyltransferase